MPGEPTHPTRHTADPGTPALVDAGASNGATTDDGGPDDGSAQMFMDGLRNGLLRFAAEVRAELEVGR